MHPETPQTGRTLEDLFAGRLIDIDQMLAQMRAVAAAEGLPFGDRRMTYNSRKAQELGKWAENQGRGDAFHDAVFRAYFADGLNIAETEVLRDVATAVGLDAESAQRCIETGRFAGEVDKDWQRSMQLGVRAVPSFRINNQMLVGAQPYEALLKFVGG